MGLSNHSLVLKNDGTLWGCGYNGYGQLGLGDTNNKTTFTEITTNTDDIKSLPNQYGDIPTIIKVYDLILMILNQFIVERIIILY